MDLDIQISNDLIPIQEYKNLRTVCGLSPKSDEAAEIGLNNSLHSVSLIIDNEVIGMGRIIGDGGSFCQIVDVCVHPNFQGQGYGKMVMENLTKYIILIFPKPVTLV